MTLFISIIFFYSLWISFSSKIYKYLNNVSEEYKIIKQNIYFSLSLGFLCIFTFLGGVNILLHSIGTTFINNPLLILFSITISILNRSNITEFLHLIFSNIKNESQNLFKGKDLIIITLSIVIAIQIICIFIRFLLPVTHSDAFSQYFYDSLQISRLEGLSISEYYQMGKYLRSDSLGSFFDAFIIQISDNWLLVRSMRAVSLILVLLSSLELAKNIGSINLRKSFLLVATIISLPDVWDIFLSGKHDGYLVLFELTGINAISLSIFSENKFNKILMTIIGIFIGLMSIGIRLSSLAFLFLPVCLLIYYLFNFPLILFKKVFKEILSSMPVSIFFFLIGIIIASSILPLMNFYYLNNPLYYLSPPGFLRNIFPNAVYRYNYEEIKELLSLKNIPILLKPITTILYASLGAEPIRYGLNKFRESNYLFLNLSSFLNYIGPKGMMVSILSFSPLTLLPYFGFRNLQDKKKHILIILTTWLLIWSISIPYTRVAIASSISLVIFAVSEPFSIKHNFKNLGFYSFLKNIIICYGFTTIIFFSFWSLSYLNDLPIYSLIKNDAYSRTSLTREYIELQNKVLGQANVVPSSKFEKKWHEIEKDNSNNILLLMGVPPQYGYFMNKGLLTNTKINLDNDKTKRFLCFELDSNTDIKKRSC